MPPKRTRDGSDSEASFTDDDDDDDDDDDEPAPDLSDGDEAEDNPSRRRSVAERLKRLQTSYPHDRDRTREWLLERVGDAEARVAAATTASLSQPRSLKCSLHSYQLDGFRWLVALHRCGLSGILADEMGLGKTAQAIALLAHLRESGGGGGGGPFLVIAPLSTLSGWALQLSSFCPALSFLQYTGAAADRAAARRRLSAASPPDIVLASFEPVLADAPELRAVAWSFAVIDEAHRLKNRASSLYRCLLDELGLGGVPRLLLTGTPMQNRAGELFSLLHFAAPSLFDDEGGFVTWLEKDLAPGGDGAAAAQRLWRPLMLRRRKAEHLSLPPKVERSVRVPLRPLQRRWYRALLEKNVSALGPASNARSLVNVLASLRKCCNHPYLFPGAEPEPFEEGEHIVAASAKLLLLDRLLRKMKPRGDRVLLFCQSTQMLDVLQDYLHLRRWSYERLDGSARAEERWAAVASFQRQPGGGGGGGSSSGSGGITEPFVFLLSTRAGVRPGLRPSPRQRDASTGGTRPREGRVHERDASTRQVHRSPGGLGLTLTAANVVIFYDHDWNPQADSQATDRVHRLGQTRPVLVLRLVCAGTVEEVILRRAHAKLLASRGVLAEEEEEEEEECGAGRPSGGPTASMAAEAIAFGLADLMGGGGVDGEGGGGAGGGGGGEGGGSGGPTDAQLDWLVSGEKSGASASGGAGGSECDSIYVFDGVDFAGSAARRRAEDTRALTALVAATEARTQLAGGGGGGGGGAAGRGRRVGPQRTGEEAAAERAKQEADRAVAEAAKRERAKQRKEQRWRKAGYTSLSLPDPTSLAGAASASGGSAVAAAASSPDVAADDSDATDGEEAANTRAGRLSTDGEEGPLRFAVGDAMRGGGSEGERIVLVFADASGRWPGKGFFRSVSALSGKPQAAYEAAHENGDLSLGDAHLVECGSGLAVCLLVVLKRDKRAPHGTPPDLCAASLDAALARLAPAAARRGASLHSPRLPSGGGGGAWYSVERLLRKHAAVQTTVYYFKR